MSWNENAASVTALIVMLVTAPSVAFDYCTTATAAWASAGGVLQLAGFGTVAWQLEHKLAQFGDRPGIRGWLKQSWRAAVDWLKRLFEGRPKGEPVELSATIGGGGKMTARGTVKAGPDTSLEMRVEALEKRMETVERRIKQVRAEARDARAKIENDLDDFHDEIDEVEDRLEGLIQQLAVGSLRWEAVGLTWFMVGVFVGTWPGAMPGA